MKKNTKVAIYRNGDKVYLAVVKNNKVTGAMCETMPEQLVTDDAVLSALKKMIKNGKVKETEAVMVLPTTDCLTKIVDAKNLSENDFRANLPFEFRDYISRGAEDEYIYDYQTLPTKDKALVYAIAAPRLSVTRMRDIAEDAGLDLVRLIPESVSYGDLLKEAARGNKTTVILEVGLSKTSVHVFSGGTCIRTNEIQDGLGSVDVMLYNSKISLYDDKVVDKDQLELLSQYEESFKRLTPKILRALQLYTQKGIIADGTPVFVAFEGALMKPFLDMLEAEGNRHFVSIYQLIPGSISPVYGPMMAPVIGAALSVK